MNDERARLFVALELPAAVRCALADWGASIVDHSSAMRPVATQALHVTLCFLGWKTVGEIDPIAAGCEPVRSFAAIELGVGDAAWLPARRPRVLAVSLLDHHGALGRLQSALSASLQAGDWYVPETRPFFGHVTVARVNRGAGPPRRSRGELPPPPQLEFSAMSVTLFRSRLGRAGARYEPLHRFELGSSARVPDQRSVPEQHVSR